MKKYFPIALLLLLASFNAASQDTATVSNQPRILFADFFDSLQKIDTVSVTDRPHLYSFFKMLNCTSGNVYFSGTGFPHIVAIKYTGKVDELEQWFDRCAAGSLLTLENCSFPRDGGLKPIVLSKTILFR